ncbi:MAG: beta-Ala-His dipeptidase [Sedimentisphaeraceae bacterium JB056]
MQQKCDIETVIELFKQISLIPRASGKEHGVCKWLENFADENNMSYTELPAENDTAPNVIIFIPATDGKKQAPSICLQAHMDMVCQKTPQSKHNFDTDPIELVFEEEWIHAKDTTLGADNGIGVAMALAAAISSNHGPLELLFTVDEEGGLGGASAIPPGQLDSKYMINLDSEDDGFIIGCAGGQRFEINKKCSILETPKDSQGFRISLSGLIGGHSGVDINKNRANAIKVCGMLLDMINSKYGLLINSINGGSQTTAIARDAELIIKTPASEKQLQVVANEVSDILRVENPSDSELKITIENADIEKACCSEESAAIITLLNSIDCGAISYCKHFPHIVETSSSIGTIRFDSESGDFALAGSERSSQNSGLEMVSERNRDTANKLAFEYNPSTRYSPWQPDTDSKLLTVCCDVYEKLTGKEPCVEIVHAGLECGVIGQMYPEMDMVSFGPLIENAHSPQERVNIESIRTNYKLLLGIIEELA